MLQCVYLLFSKCVAQISADWMSETHHLRGIMCTPTLWYAEMIHHQKKYCFTKWTDNPALLLPLPLPTNTPNAKEKSISSALWWWAAASVHSWEYHWWQKMKLWRGAEGRISKCFPFSKSPWTHQSKEVPLSSDAKRETLWTPLRDMRSSCQADQIKGGPCDAQSHEEKLRN